jgi:hypothetical protein
MSENAYVTKLVADAWHGIYDTGGEVENPSLGDVEYAIERLDGRTHTLVMLGTSSEAHMAVGGGAEQHVVYVTHDNRSFWSLMSPRAPEQLIRLNVGGQEGEFPATKVVTRELAMKAARAFFANGEREPSLTWKEDS